MDKEKINLRKPFGIKKKILIVSLVIIALFSFKFLSAPEEPTENKEQNATQTPNSGFDSIFDYTYKKKLPSHPQEEEEIKRPLASCFTSCDNAICKLKGKVTDDSLKAIEGVTVTFKSKCYNPLKTNIDGDFEAKCHDLVCSSLLSINLSKEGHQAIDTTLVYYTDTKFSFQLKEI